MKTTVLINRMRRNDRLLFEENRHVQMLDPIIGYAQEPLLSLADACSPLVNIVHDLFRYVSMALERTPDRPADGLTRAESASIRLYTMEWKKEQRSFYTILNHTLRTADRQCLQPWFRYLKLFLTALTKIPCAPLQVVWRGVAKDITEQFPDGSEVIWWAFSSCTTRLCTLESDQYLGQSGRRTLLSIEVFNGRNIRAHSDFHTEDEILMLPGTFMRVQSHLNPARDLHIIHLTQKQPEDMLLEPPYEGKLSSAFIN